MWIFVIDSRSKSCEKVIKNLLKPQRKCKDWNDYEFIKAEGRRIGPGEQGKAVKLVDQSEITLNEKLYNQTGFSVVVSDKISVSRSIPDFRVEECRNQKNLAVLPNVSVIIIFHNEVKSVLLRTVHSVINRTPPELLHEIILVNDNSNHSELYEPLQTHVDENFHGKVKIKNLSERKGLIVTRLEGGRIATGEVLVFFDSHMEVGYNWLPPLLDPIAVNRRLATVPMIDNFNPDSFEFTFHSPLGTRGGFDWYLIWRTFERYLPEKIDQTKPYPSPIMLGCAFAIDRKFFLEELDGYDEGFQIWNAENYELSFKLWLCADGLFEVPCSRVAHTFRRINPSRQRKDDFVAKNFKRLAEVWMDEYKEVVYSFDPSRYAKVEAGDLTKAKEVHDRLNCKPFKYFVEEIGPEILNQLPPLKDSPDFASGQIRSLTHEDICIDTFARPNSEPIGLYKCQRFNTSENPPQTQFFHLNFFKNIILDKKPLCIDAFSISLYDCHLSTEGNQIWKLDQKNHWLINNDKCLTGHFDNSSLSLDPCNATNPNQMWKFTYENETALNDWDNIYGYRKLKYDKMMPLDYEIC
jgi:polypeptide N-acetylgalactosaminyltransferase